MLLRHATPACNLDSIRELGLLAGKSKGLMRCVWFHSGTHSEWACGHVQVKHKCDLEDVAVLLVTVPRAAVHMHRKGVYFTFQDIPTKNIIGSLLFPQLEMAPFLPGIVVHIKPPHGKGRGKK